MMLNAADYFFTFLHIIIIIFNLFGWIFPSTRRWNFYSLSLTAFCWFVLGIFYGMGYCPLTDWQWSIKRQLGEMHLPDSFITYALNKITGHNFEDATVNIFVGVSFGMAVLLSVYFNFFKKYFRGGS